MASKDIEKFLNTEDDIEETEFQEDVVEEGREKENSAQRRILTIYSRLIEGKSFTRDELAQEFGVSLRTVQRDINTIKDFVQDSTVEGKEPQTVRCLSSEGYVLDPPMRSMLGQDEAFTLLKMLMECRALTKKEMESLKNKIVECCIPTKQKTDFLNKINSEWINYVEPRHHKELIAQIWEIEQAVREQRVLKINYINVLGKEKAHHVMPVGVIVNEYYFYMLAYIKTKEEECREDIDKYPTVFRIDRIASMKKKRDKFRLPYAKQFPEGEFRKRVPFMFTGPLHRIKLYVKNYAVEAAMDKLPSAEILSRDDERTLLKVEVYGEKGFEMWLKSQEGVAEVVKDIVVGKGSL